MVAVRAEETNRPRRKTTKKVVNLFPDDDSEPEPAYDSDVEHDQEYTDQDALREAGKKSWDDESSEDDGDDDDDIPQDVSAANPSKKKKRKGDTAKPLPYSPPEDMAEICREYRERRVEDMIEELEMFDEENSDFDWTPNETDNEEIERTVLSRWVIFFNLYGCEQSTERSVQYSWPLDCFEPNIECTECTVCSVLG